MTVLHTGTPADRRQIRGRKDDAGSHIVESGSAMVGAAVKHRSLHNLKRKTVKKPANPVERRWDTVRFPPRLPSRFNRQLWLGN
jgi:hypothetical protein